MKQALLIVSLLSAFVIVFGQKRFEGIIVYTIHDNEGKGDHELTALFGRAGIKVKYREKDDYDKDILLISLDSGVIYTINESAKTFTAKNLLVRQLHRDLPDKMIAGYNTRAVDMSDKLSFLQSLRGLGGKLILYPSDSLFYPVPDKYSANPELVIVNNSHIVLGADFTIGVPSVEEDNEQEDSTDTRYQTMVNIFAKEITWRSFDEKEFQVPPGYTFNQHSYDDYLSDSTIVRDTADVMADTVATKPLPPVSKTIPKQGSRPKNKTKASSNKDIHKNE